MDYASYYNPVQQALQLKTFWDASKYNVGDVVGKFVDSPILSLQNYDYANKEAMNQDIYARNAQRALKDVAGSYGLGSGGTGEYHSFGRQMAQQGVMQNMDNALNTQNLADLNQYRQNQGTDWGYALNRQANAVKYSASDLMNLMSMQTQDVSVKQPFDFGSMISGLGSAIGSIGGQIGGAVGKTVGSAVKSGYGGQASYNAQ